MHYVNTIFLPFIFPLSIYSSKITENLSGRYRVPINVISKFISKPESLVSVAVTVWEGYGTFRRWRLARGSVSLGMGFYCV